MNIWYKVKKGLYAFNKNGECLGFVSYKGRRYGKHDWLIYAVGGRINHSTSLRGAKVKLEEKLI